MYLLFLLYFYRCGGTNLFSVCPWAAQSINVLNAEDQLKEVWFPDINPYDMPRDAEFSMAAGDFLEVNLFLKS
jgi:carnosine N-methyltransferase